jgi:hypothetical protein
MDSPYSSQSRAERVIATGRVMLAAFSLLAIWLDPSGPSQYAQVAYGLLAAYVCYGVAVAWLVWRARAPLGALRLVTHVLDLAIFSVFM